MASRRARITNRGVSDHQELLAAIKAIKIDKKSVKSTAAAHKIDRKTLARHIVKFDAEVPDIAAVSDEELLVVIRRIASYATTALAHMIFNNEQEEALVVYAMKCCMHNCGLSINELKQLAYQYARTLEIEYPRSWDRLEMAGKQWCYGFMQRHTNIYLRRSEQTSMNRMELDDINKKAVAMRKEAEKRKKSAEKPNTQFLENVKDLHKD